MVMVLEHQMVAEIARIGTLRIPCEACGLLLPYSVRGRQVIEVPNRSSTPHDSIEMWGEDIVIELQSIYPDDIPDSVLDDLVVWHTHPGGNIGPSKYDLENKPPDLASLVVTLRGHEPPLATWF